MADETRNRDRNADAEEGRQPDREREAMRDRSNEGEPKHGDRSEQLGALDSALETLTYPTTTNELVETYGDHSIETQTGEQSLADVLAATEDQTFDSADDVRSRILGLIHR